MFLWQTLYFYETISTDYVFLFVARWRRNYYIYSELLVKRLEQHLSEEVSRMFTVKKAFIETSKNSQNTPVPELLF